MKRHSSLASSVFAVVLLATCAGAVLCTPCTQPCLPGVYPFGDIKATKTLGSNYSELVYAKPNDYVWFHALTHLDPDTCGDNPSVCYDTLSTVVPDGQSHCWTTSDANKLICTATEYQQYQGFAGEIKFYQEGTYYYYWDGYGQLSPPADGWVKLWIKDAGTYAHDVPVNECCGVLTDSTLANSKPCVVIVDGTPPNPGKASSPAYASSSPIHVTYTGAYDTGGSELQKVELWYKKGSGGTWTDSDKSSTGADGSFDFDLVSDDDTYYFDLVAWDNAGNQSDDPSAEGDCHTVYDTSPPSTRVVTDEGVYQTDKTRLHATWTCSDSGSGIAEYQYAVGTSPTDPETGYTFGWTPTGVTDWFTLEGLSLAPATYYVYVKAKNDAGMWSQVGVSDGIVVGTELDFFSGLVQYCPQ